MAWSVLTDPRLQAPIALAPPQAALAVGGLQPRVTGQSNPQPAVGTVSMVGAAVRLALAMATLGGSLAFAGNAPNVTPRLVTPRAPIAGAMSWGGAAPALTVQSGGGGGLSALQDWINRSTAAGVTQAMRFNIAANVTNNTHQDGDQANVSQDTTDGILGDGCLKIVTPKAADTGSGQWRLPLNAAWTSGGGQNQGMGNNKYYVQYRVKLGPNRLQPVNIPGGSTGWKCNILSGYNFASPNSSYSDTNNEVVLTNFSYAGVPTPYYYNGNSGQLQFPVGPTVTWRWVEDQWITIYIILQIPIGGGQAGTSYDLFVGYDGQATPVHLFSELNNFPIGSDNVETPNGHNGIWFLPYDSNRLSGNFDTWMKWDQLIVSLQPIAWPQAPSISLGAAPAYHATSADKQWKQPLGTWLGSPSVKDPLADTTNSNGLTGYHSIVDAYNGYGCDRSTGEICWPACGGHSDYAGNEIYWAGMRSSSPAYGRRRNATASSGDGANHRTWSDGRPVGGHAYDTRVSANARHFIVSHRAVNYQGGTNGARAIFEAVLNAPGLDNVNNDWVDHGDVLSADVNTTQDSWGGYDPAMKWLIHVSGNSISPSLQVFDISGPPGSATPLVTSSTSVMTDGNYYMGAVDTNRRILLINNGSGWFWFPLYALTTGGAAWHSINITGTNLDSVTGFEYHPASGAFLTWKAGVGLVKIIPGVSVNGTVVTYTGLTGSVVSGVTGTIPPPPNPANASLYGRIGIIDNMGDGRSQLNVHPAFQNPDLCTLALPAGGV